MAKKILELEFDYKKQPCQLILFNDKIKCQRKDWKTDLADFETFLTKGLYYLPPKIDLQVLKTLASVITEEKLSTEAAKILKFYCSFDSEKIISNSIKDPERPLSTNYTRSITSFGIIEIFTKSGEISNYQRFDDFFFNGPVFIGLDIELRKDWRNSIWNALSEPRPFILEDGFILLDYNKIEPKSFKKSFEYYTETLSIDNGYLTLSHEEYFNDRHLRKSLESFWYKGLLNNIFKDIEPELREIIGKAIIS